MPPKRRKAATTTATKRKSTTTTKAVSSSKKAKKNADADKKKDIDERSLVPIDASYTGCKGNHYVYHDGPGDVYNAMLNQTNIQANNNKFYLLQIIKRRGDNDDFVLWLRWGRIGRTVGVSAGSMDRERAIAEFKKKFRAKTGNAWESRGDFVKKKGKYDLIEVDYENDDDNDDGDNKKQVTTEPDKKIESKLDKRVQDLIGLIFDVKEWERSMTELGFDVKRSPLGKLTKAQVRAGYESLKRISNILAGPNRNGLTEACSEFYTRIPHNFGMRRPELINTPQQVKQKIQLLESLDDIQIGLEMMSGQDEEEGLSRIDANYKSLNCELTPLAHDGDEFALISDFVANTHGETHSAFSLRVMDAYDVSRPSDNQRFAADIQPRMLLWHGSRLMNWCGILGQGLRIAPPEAPVSGYMFGKGIYFADMVSKSAGYCRASKRNPVGLLLLCEVALGEMNEKIHADYNAAKLPVGKSSTKGMGRTSPDMSKCKMLEGEVQVPLGKPSEKSAKNNTVLLYNEYIVYDVKQVRPRFLVKVKFNFTY